jgi:hypothetical protein
MTLGLALSAPAQVKTEMPPVVPGAKPVAVERIKIHDAALEGNLEGNSADREVFVFLPPSYAMPNPAAIRSSTPCTDSIGAEQWTNEIHVP